MKAITKNSNVYMHISLKDKTTLVTGVTSGIGREIAQLASSVDLATQRYVGGRSSYYEVLQAQQELYPTQRAQVQAQVGELIAVIQLYKALGGGWQGQGL